MKPRKRTKEFIGRDHTIRHLQLTSSMSKLKLQPLFFCKEDIHGMLPFKNQQTASIVSLHVYVQKNTQEDIKVSHFSAHNVKYEGLLTQHPPLN